MALIVKSGVGKLNRFYCSKRVAELVVLHLTSEGMSFYCEPFPEETREIVVDDEYAHIVRRLIEQFQAYADYRKES